MCPNLGCLVKHFVKIWVFEVKMCVHVGVKVKIGQNLSFEGQNIGLKVKMCQNLGFWFFISKFLSF